MAGTTRLELATSAVTGQRSNQLNYVPNYEISDLPENLAGQGFCKFCIQRIRRYCPQWQLSLPKPLINFRAHARFILTQRIGGVFTPVLAKHSKSFPPHRLHFSFRRSNARNFAATRRQVDAW